jgi:hypothetical protein
MVDEKDLGKPRWIKALDHEDFKDYISELVRKRLRKSKATRKSLRYNAAAVLDSGFFQKDDLVRFHFTNCIQYGIVTQWKNINVCFTLDRDTYDIHTGELLNKKGSRYMATSTALEKYFGPLPLPPEFQPPILVSPPEPEDDLPYVSTRELRKMIHVFDQAAKVEVKQKAEVEAKQSKATKPTTSSSVITISAKPKPTGSPSSATSSSSIPVSERPPSVRGWTCHKCKETKTHDYKQWLINDMDYCSACYRDLKLSQQAQKK